MRFHGIQMDGPFVNQKLSSLPIFSSTRDSGRFVWLTNGTLWYGNNTEWIEIGGGGGGGGGTGDATEVEDLYSDLLRTTVFLNASYDGFTSTDLVEFTDMEYTSNSYVYENGRVITSKNLYDSSLSMSYVDYVMVYVDYSGNDSIIEVSSDGGGNWSIVSNHTVFRINDLYTGTNLKIRFTGVGSGEIYSWGILYNRDPNASCTKQGLMYKRFDAADGQTSFEVNYTVGAIQVFLNGNLLDNSDFVANDGENVILAEPLTDGDIVYIVSFTMNAIMTDEDNWEVVSVNTTATNKKNLFVNTTSASVTITAPLSPTRNMYFVVSDYAGTFGSHNCIINGNGAKVMGSSSSLTLSANNSTTKLVYVDVTQGWKIV